jgi:hypothetical protein
MADFVARPGFPAEPTRMSGWRDNRARNGTFAQNHGSALFTKVESRFGGASFNADSKVGAVSPLTSLALYRP